MEKLRELIRQAIAKVLDEENVTSGGEAYMTKFAFSKGGKNRATKTAEKLGYKLVGNRPKVGKTYEFVKYEGQDPINEVSYRSFTKTVSEISPERKISKAILGIKKRLREINQIVDYSIRLREENSLTTENYLTNSVRGLEEISEQLKELDKKIKNTYRTLMTRGMKACFVHFYNTNGVMIYKIQIPSTVRNFKF